MKLLSAMNHMTTTGAVVNHAVERCKELGWDYVHAGSDYTAIIIAWNDKNPRTYREMVVVDGMSETLEVETTEGYAPAFDPAVAAKIESFQLQHAN